MEAPDDADQEDAREAYIALARCQLWMCRIEDLVKLPSQWPQAKHLAAVKLAMEARDFKSKGNVRFQAGDFSVAEEAYSKGTVVMFHAPLIHSC